MDGQSVAQKRIRSVVGRIIRIAGAWMQAILLSPVVAVVVLVRPFVLIRFGEMEGSRIGHLCNMEGYLCARDLRDSSQRILDFTGRSSVISNHQLEAMFRRAVPTFSGGIVRWLSRSCVFWTKSKLHHFDPSTVQELRLLDTVKPHLGFTDGEHRLGQGLLQRLGIPLNAEWVCLHNRDSAYLNKTQSGTDWTYHGFRDSSVGSLELAVNELVKRGYYVLRMGSAAAQPLISSSPMVIDYANHGERSEFADIYLLANCRFYLGSESGIFAVSAIFRRPFAFVNYPIPEPCYNLYDWNPVPFTIKRAWHNGKGRLLSLREVFDLGLANVLATKAFEEADVRLVENDPEDVCDLAKEVDDRILGVWEETEFDLELQRRFWNIFRQHAPPPLSDGREFRARIGAAFLRKHVDLLN